MMHTCRGLLISCMAGGLLACHNSANSDAVIVTMRLPTGASIGDLTLIGEPGGVRVSGQLTGVPAGMHGIHFHSAARCDGPDFVSAGAHVNPTQRQHGLSNPDGPHLGDLPNVEATAAGLIELALTTARVTLDGAPATGLLDGDGSALVLHALADDQRSDPAGASGARIACGTVRR